MEIQRDPAFRWPTKLRGDMRKQDRTKFCEYHNDHGHLTEDWITLRQEIKNFIRNGGLVKFLAGERNRDMNFQEPLLLERVREVRARDLRRDCDNGRRDESRPLQDQEVVGENHIYDEVASGGQSISAKKGHARKIQAKKIFLLQRPPKIVKKDSMVISFFFKMLRG